MQRKSQTRRGNKNNADREFESCAGIDNENSLIQGHHKETEARRSNGMRPKRRNGEDINVLVGQAAAK